MIRYAKQNPQSPAPGWQPPPSPPQDTALAGVGFWWKPHLRSPGASRSKTNIVPPHPTQKPPYTVSQRCSRLNQSWLLQKPQGTDVSSAARTLTANLQQLRWAIKALLTSAMKNPMSNIIFGMAGSCALSNRNIRRCYFECAGSKVIEISLKPSRRL
jgi:hypothetical protein